MQTAIFAYFSPGPGELLVVGMIALLLFGKRLPEVARSLGKGIVEFKKGVRGIEDEVDGAVYSSSSSVSSSSRPAPKEEEEELTAPKFEPPESEPETAENSDDPSTDDEMH